jgi:hypothetical protein
LSSKDEAALEGAGMVEENALQASLFDQSSASVGGEENAVNNSMELMESVEQDDVNVPVPNIPPPCLRLSIQSQDDTRIDGVEEVTPSIHAGLRRVEELMKAQKTKNSSNKIEERTSIAGAIVKLAERQESGGIAASMLMMLMRQLDAMNSSLDRCEQWERKQERRERKKRKLCKKRCAMTCRPWWGWTAVTAAAAIATASTVTAIAAVTLVRVVIMGVEVGGMEET